MTIKEISKQIAELEKQKRELELQEIAEHQELAKQHIGRCFKINGDKYAKVIGVPQVMHRMIGFDYNKYQYPAIFIGVNCCPDVRETSIVPFHEGKLFAGAWGEGHDMFNTYEEITPEKFCEKFREKLREFCEKISVE